jgi:hypothetical protein
MKNIIKISIILLLLTSCQSAKDALTLQKKNSTDEFLVEKKSPLVLPPKYGELPIPDENKIKDDQIEDEGIKSLVSSKEKSSTAGLKKNSKPTSIENSILDKIK